MKRAFVIIRVSAEDQLKGYGPDVQWYDDILPNASLLGLEVSETLRRVIQESATTWERVKFEATVREALELHKNGQVEALLFPRVDRETRFVFGSFPLLAEVVRAGLGVYFAREKLHLDPEDPESVERYLSKATQAQAYIETMKVNTARGRRARALGKDGKSGKLPTGRGVFYGYSYDKGKAQNIGNSCLDTVRMVGMWLIAERIFLNEACRRLMKMGIPAPKGGMRWSRSTLGRIMRNPAYAGKSYAYKTTTKGKRRVTRPQEEQIEIPNTVDRPAFTWDEWLAIQRQLDKNQELSPRNQKLDYLLRGIVHCKQCGRKYYGVPVHKQPYYRCSGRIKLLSNAHCSNKTMNAKWLETTVWSEVEKVLRDPDLILAEVRRQREAGTDVSHLEERVSLNNARLIALDEAETRYLRLYGANLYSLEKLDKECQRVKQDREKIEQDNINLNQSLTNMRELSTNSERIEQVCNLVNKNLENLNPSERRAALEALNITVWIDGDSVTLEGTIPVSEVDIVSQPS